MNLDIYQQIMNSKIKVSIIGLGKWGNNIKNSIKNEVEFVEPNNADWVIISTPNDLHYEQVKYFLSKNKNVFCEKPMTLTWNTTNELFSYAEEQGVKLYVDDVFLWREDIPSSPTNFKWSKIDNSNFIDRLSYHHFYLWLRDKSNVDIHNIDIESNEKFNITLVDGYKGSFNYTKCEKNVLHTINSKEVLKNLSINPLKKMLLSVFNNKVNYQYNRQITLNATKLSEEVKKIIYPKALIVGGGIFGSTAAITLANKGYNVELHEELDDIMKGATGINQYRLHKGYHYPRSKETAIECKKGLKTFSRKYENCFLNKKIEHLYAISTENSLVTPEEYLEFLNKVDLSYKKTSPLPNTDLTVKVDEKLFDSWKLYNLLKLKLEGNGVRVKLNKKSQIKDFEKYDLVVIATYAKLNELRNIKKKYQFEICEKPIVKLPKDYKNKSIVVMDGPFMCLDPYGESNYHVLGSVDHAIHATNIGEYPVVSKDLKNYLNKGIILNPKITNIDKFIELGKKYFGDNFKNLEHIGSMYTIRTVLTNREYDDARPTLVKYEGNNIYSLFSGKIDTCVDASNQLIKLINEINNLKKENL